MGASRPRGSPRQSNGIIKSLEQKWKVELLSGMSVVVELSALHNNDWWWQWPLLGGKWNQLGQAQQQSGLDGKLRFDVKMPSLLTLKYSSAHLLASHCNPVPSNSLLSFVHCCKDSVLEHCSAYVDGLSLPKLVHDHYCNHTMEYKPWWIHTIPSAALLLALFLVFSNMHSDRSRQLCKCLQMCTLWQFWKVTAEWFALTPDLTDGHCGLSKLCQWSSISLGADCNKRY